MFYAGKKGVFGRSACWHILEHLGGRPVQNGVADGDACTPNLLRILVSIKQLLQSCRELRADF